MNACFKSSAPEAQARELSKAVGPASVRGTARVVDRNQLKSLHFHVPCVACRTRVDETVERGKNDKTTATIFHQSRGKDPVALELDGKRFFLPLNLWLQEAPSRRETSSLRPNFVTRGAGLGERSYAISESILQEGQQVFIAGSLSPQGQTLASDPALHFGGVLVFAGTQAEYLEQLRGKAQAQRFSGLICVGLGLTLLLVRRNSQAAQPG